MKRRKRPPPPPFGATEVEIVGLGKRGWGEARHDGHRLWVPLALPGDRLIAEPEAAVEGGWRARAAQWIESAPRESPICGHFGACGGCALQHAPEALANAWALERARRALGDGVALEPVWTPPPGARRRVRWAVERRGGRFVCGLRRSRSRQIEPLARCPILVPELEALLTTRRLLLRALLDAAAPSARSPGFELAAARHREGDRMWLDLTLIGAPPPFGDPAKTDALAVAARALGLARLGWTARPGEEIETLLALETPQLRFGAFRLSPPLGGFAQPTEPSERAIVAFVREALAGCARIADLYAGCGPIGLSLDAEVDLYEHDRPAIDAAKAAIAARPGCGRRAFRRDLEREPLDGRELAAYDAVILDPPRSGARRQCRAIAKSAHRPKILYVSCNPETLARDARILGDAGYAPMRALPLRQFHYSAELELAVAFARSRSGASR